MSQTAVSISPEQLHASVASPNPDIEWIPITSRQQWLELRRRDITASDVASICGVGRRTALAVWAEKTGRVPAQADSAVMKKGRWFEPAIFEALREERPSWDVRRANIYLRSISHRLGATPDGLGIDPDHPGIMVIEGKVVARPVFRSEWVIDNDDDLPIKAPLAHQLQVLTASWLAERAYGQPVRAVIVALVHDTYSADLHIIDVPRHAEAEAKILARVDSFWHNTDAGLMPAHDAARDDDIIDALYPSGNGAEIDLSGDNELPGLIDERAALGARIKADEARRTLIRTEIAAKMGEASYARLADGRRLSLTTTNRPEYTVKASTYRTLRVTRGGKP